MAGRVPGSRSFGKQAIPFLTPAPDTAARLTLLPAPLIRPCATKRPMIDEDGPSKNKSRFGPVRSPINVFTDKTGVGFTLAEGLILHDLNVKRDCCFHAFDSELRERPLHAADRFIAVGAQHNQLGQQ